MSKTKKLSQYNGSAWSTPIDIGADAANVDYPTTTQGVTKNLTEVIGNVATGDSPLQTQISTKLSSTGAIDNTVLNQGPDTTTYPVTGTNVSDGSLAVTANNSSRSLWSKFNAFRARLINRIATFVDADMSDTSDVTIADTIDADTLDGTLGSTIKGDIQNNTAAIAELNDSLYDITQDVLNMPEYYYNTTPSNLSNFVQSTAKGSLTTIFKISDNNNVLGLGAGWVKGYMQYQNAYGGSYDVMGMGIASTQGGNPMYIKITGSGSSYTVTHRDLTQDTNTTTGTTYNAGSCPDNTTFSTNGSVKRVYDVVYNKGVYTPIDNAHRITIKLHNNYTLYFDLQISTGILYLSLRNQNNQTLWIHTFNPAS